MKETKIVIAGKYGQTIVGPFFTEGEDAERAERYAEDLNKLITDPDDKARVMKLGDAIPTPQSVAKELNAIELPGLQTAPEILDMVGGSDTSAGAKFTDDLGFPLKSEQAGDEGEPLSDAELISEISDEDLETAFGELGVPGDTDDTEPNRGD